jgi:hypothetical protein
MRKYSIPSSQRIGRGTNSQGNNLSGIQPGHSKPTDSEKGVEDKEENCLSNSGLLIIEMGQAVVAACKNSH